MNLNPLRAAGALAVLTAAVVVAGCAPSSSPSGGSTPDPATGGDSPSSSGGAADGGPSDAMAESGEDFSLDDLVAAAKAEKTKITVYDSTGKVKQIAENFTAKYSIPAEGIKSKAPETVEKMTREAQAGNVTVDVAVISDIPSIVQELIPQGIAANWLPPDLAQDIPESQQSPLVAVMSPDVVAYNTEAYPDGCPVTNMWELTDADWEGRFAMSDPLNEPDMTDWFSELTINGADALSEAYRDAYGEDLQTDEKNAAWEWVKRLAGNAPIVFKSDEDIAASVGARGQQDPPIGLMSVAKFRDVEDKDYALGVCGGLKPWLGFASPKSVVLATGSAAPNSAKLFIHFLMTAEGIAPQVADGKISGNSSVPPDPDDPSGLADHIDELFRFDTASAVSNWERRQPMQDFWRVNHA